MQDNADLNQPAFFNNRELSWLAFNDRVLEESMDERNPLLERLKFLAIFSSNLDEFFMVRVAGLKDQIEARFMKPENKAGLTPKEQITEITKITHDNMSRQYSNYKHLLDLLEKEDVSLLSIREVPQDALIYLEKHFDEVIFPVLTPMAIDAYRPFPLLANKSMNLAVVLSEHEEGSTDPEKLAIVQVPRGFQRFVEVAGYGEHGRKQFVLIEDVISHFVHKLFHGLHVQSVTQFRITRNADLEIHEEGARDLLEEIEEELKMRKWGATVRLEIAKNFFDPDILSYLLDELEIHQKDAYLINGPLDLTFLFSFYKQFAPLKKHLIFEKYNPQPVKDIIQVVNGGEKNIFDIAKTKDILLHHPYESFEPVIDLVRSAAEDPNVLAIKQTLYRVSGNSPIIENLKRAAENGKQVLVLVELKARFDEEHNVHWAKELEKSGCHVIYGKTFLKTHSKITLIVRKMNDTIQRFVHLGTGNYNEETAKVYTDLGLITSNPEFGVDATNFFNYLSGFMEKPDFQHFYVSPIDIREHFIQLIDEEIEFHQQFGNGRIIAKMNSVTDKKIIVKLYEASRAGVRIDMIVRGICCLRPDIDGVSENIRVISIVGRFLEHSRVYYFHHNGREKIFLSSADLMTRNMENRVEIAFPVLDNEQKDRIKQILSIQLRDNVKARIQDQYGNYYYVSKCADDLETDSQMIFLGMAYQAADDDRE
ncbi:RNA degradosome polyphosphate kinase [Bacillus sp. T33-2]|uniref:RNA degradosome polyphosphate kinase n=1 Tax=Bacillus sp. T33-2 TaxID=2054168 RepID=UPI000C77B7AF|nr:RNA degradosome polyphosphate kinase [Bacillus sp. T33-2]PLR92854.1 RNA degradosome polyphosphate kinase [Bacillus sp. T33-2]